MVHPLNIGLYQWTCHLPLSIINKSLLQAHSYITHQPNYTQENQYYIKLLIVNILVSPRGEQISVQTKKSNRIDSI